MISLIKGGSLSLLLLITFSCTSAYAQLGHNFKVELNKVRDGLITQFAMKDSSRMYILKEYNIFSVDLTAKKPDLEYFFGENEDSLKYVVKNQIQQIYGCMYEFDFSIAPAKFQPQFGVSNFFMGQENLFAIMHIAMPTISYNINDQGQIIKNITKGFFFFMVEINEKGKIKNTFYFDKHAQLIKSNEFYSGGVVQLPNNKFAVYSNGALIGEKKLYYAVEYQLNNTGMISLSSTFSLDSLDDILTVQPQYSTKFISSGIYGDESILCFKNSIQKFDKSSVNLINNDYNIIGVVAKLPNAPIYLLAVLSEENRKNYILKYDYKSNNEEVINEFENIFYLIDIQGIYIHTITSDGKYFFYERYAIRGITK